MQVIVPYLVGAAIVLVLFLGKRKETEKDKQIHNENTRKLNEEFLNNWKF